MLNAVMLNRKYILIFSMIFFNLFMFGQNTIKWYTLDEAQQLSKIQPRKIMVEVFTDRCSWCNKLDNTTLSHPQIIKYINEKYYPVKMDPEKQNKVFWKGKEYNLISIGKRSYNEWFIAHSQGHLSFPSLIFLDEDHDIIQNIPGFQDVFDMARIITYFGTNAHKTVPWTKYTYTFNTKDFLFR